MAKGVLKGIENAFQMMPTLVKAIGSLGLLVVIFAVLMGVFVEETTNGNIDIGNNSQQTIQDQSANFSSFVGDIWEAVYSVTGFIIVGVILIIAGVFLGKRFMGGGSKGL
jgi:predicted transporter